MNECNKKYFRNKKTSKKKAKELGHIYNKKYEIYRCNECDCLHLTSKKTMGEKQFFRQKLD